MHLSSHSGAASSAPPEARPFDAMDTTSVWRPTAEAHARHQSSGVHNALHDAGLEDTSQSQAQSQGLGGVGSSWSRGSAIEEAQEGVGEGRLADGMPKGESEGDSLIGQGPSARFCRICFEGEGKDTARKGPVPKIVIPLFYSRM